MQLERPRTVDTSSSPATTSSARRVHEHELGPAPLPPDFGQVAGLARENDGRTVTSQRPMSSISQNQDESAVSSDTQISKDLVASLSDAENTFVAALHTLIRQNLAAYLSADSKASITQNAQGASSTFAFASGSPKLAPLLQDLRDACEALDDPFSHEMRQLGALSTDDSALIQEIRSKIEYLAPYFASSDRQIAASAKQGQAAKSLASLLGCIDRLKALYTDSPSLAVNADIPSLDTSFDEAPAYSHSESHATGAKAAETSAFHKLHRQSKLLQLSSARMHRTESQDSANAVRAVEEAEVELLWGRVDDLLDLVVQAQAPPGGSRAHSEVARREKLRSGVDQELVGPTPLMVNDDATFASQHNLPEYSALDPPEYAYEGSKRAEYASEKADPLDGDEEEQGQPLSRVRTRSSRVHPGLGAGASDEKMQMDLDRMTTAIERLYTTAPQLANQRVDSIRPSAFDRAQLREAQLARLESAIERLGKGRLEDQRAALPVSEAVSAKDSGTFFARLAGPASATANGKGKFSEDKKQSLDRLLDSIDKAANRTLDDQRASMSDRQRDAISGARKTARLAMNSVRYLDSDEIAFREHLFDSTVKGRLTSQDATFTSPSTASRASAPSGGSFFGGKLGTKRRSLAHIYNADGSPGGAPVSDAFDSSGRARSCSLGSTPPIPPIPAEHQASVIKQTGKEPTVKKRFSVSRLLSAKDGSSLSANNASARTNGRVSPSNSRPNSAYNDLPLPLYYVVEEMRNLSSMIVRVWDDRFESSAAQSMSGRLSQEAWSAQCLDSGTLQLATSHESATVKLASHVATSVSPSKQLDLLYKGDHYELRLPTAESSFTTRSREDLEIHIPYTAAEFRRYSPKSFICSSCGTQVADLTAVSRYNDLPSEHWAELLDAWMCHHDQQLSDELIQKGNNVWPKDDQLLISLGALCLSAKNARSCVVAQDLESTIGADGHWQSIRCASCSALIGKGTSGPGAPESDTPAYIRLVKHAVQPVSRSGMAVCSLSGHITSTLLETSLARAVHRFIVEDNEEGSARMLLWLFNPFVCISTSNTSLSTSPVINAVKVLYRVGNDLDDATVARLLGNAEYETVSYPSRICSQLRDLLESSTYIYPRSQQQLGEWTVGWLERAASRP